MKREAKVKLAQSTETARRLKMLCTLRPKLAIVLGTGWQPVVDSMLVIRRIPFRQLPGFPTGGVEGHASALLFGRLASVPILVLAGRAHYYEGLSMEDITFPIRAIAAFGIQAVVLTSSVGAINRKYRVGDFVVINDHINFMGANPLRETSHADPARFVDLQHAYDPRLAAALRTAGERAGVRVHAGVYLAVAGPSYETPAEIRAFERWGADVVGMSTVPEAIVARQSGLSVAGISCVTNLASGRHPGPLSHADVLAMAKKSGGAASRLLRNFVARYEPSG